MSNNSLLNYLREDLGELLREPNIKKKDKDLERSIAEAYEPLRSELNDLGKRQRGIFDIYVDAQDISEEHIQRYLEGIKTLERSPYRTVDPNSLSDKVLNKTRGWYQNCVDAKDISEGHIQIYLKSIKILEKYPYRTVDPNSLSDKVLNKTRGWYENKDGSTKFVPLVDGPFFASLIAGIVGGIVDVALAISEGNPMYLTISIPFALTSFGLYHIFKNKNVPELKPLERRFEKDEARNYVIELERLHRLTQEIEREVEDINTITGKERKDFIRKYGSERMEREKVSLKRLASEERESRILEYGAREIEERINRAKKEVATVKNHIEKILEVAGAEILPLEDDYTSHGEKIYNGEREDLEIVDRALKESELEEQLKQLREDRLRKEKIKQGVNN